MNTLTPSSLFWFLSLAYGAGVCLPMINLLLPKPVRNRWGIAPVHFSLAITLAGSVIAIAGAVFALRNPAAWGTQTLLVTGVGSIPYLPRLALEVRVDALSAFFILLIAGFAMVVAIYSFGALSAPHYRAQLTRIAVAFNAFVWSTLAVVIVNDLFSLFAALELMTLAFGFLTLYKHTYYHTDGAESRPDWYHVPDAAAIKDARLAPQIYFIISHTSTAFLLLASLLLALGAGGLSFDVLRLQAASRSPVLATAVFLLALAGLGIRAGLTPAHFWVSLVHPASPTTTHAFSLGIGIKVAIYLMCRFFFQFLPPQVWWGYLLLVVAVATALVNVWYAIASHDLKKALAYHSIENIGIIAVGIGVALICVPSPDQTGQWIAGLALVAALYHLLNHAIFKGLLYLCTGAIDDRTGQEVDIEHLGGLIRLWPWTSGAFLIGALAIAGFPPLNGFVSEWLTVQALLRVVRFSSAGSLLGAVGLALSMALLVASFALTAFCFLKISGLALLGSPRATPETVAAWKTHSASDVRPTMRIMMLVLAVLCFVLGVLPGLVMPLLADAAGTILQRDVTVSSGGLARLTLSPPLIEQEASQSADVDTLAQSEPTPEVVPPTLAILPMLLAALAVAGGGLVATRFWRRAVLHPETPWNGGTPYVPAQSQFTGAALSFLVRDLLGAGLRPIQPMQGPDYMPARLEMSAGALNAPSAQQIVVEVFRVGYNRITGWLLTGSTAIARWGQNGDLGRYLLYILFANLAVLLLFLAIGR